MLLLGFTLIIIPTGLFKGKEEHPLTYHNQNNAFKEQAQPILTGKKILQDLTSCFTLFSCILVGVFIWPKYFTMGDDQSHPPCLNPAPFLWKDVTILQKQPKSIRSILLLFRRMFFKDKTQYVDRVTNTNKGEKIT